MNEISKPMPKAGWYRAPDKSGDLRWWDGQQWVHSRGSLSPNLPASKAGKNKGFKTTLVALVTLIVLIIVVQVGIHSSDETADTKSASSVPASASTPAAPPAPVIPQKSAAEVEDDSMEAQGFRAAVSGELYVRALNTSDFTCGYSPCLYYEVVTIPGCPNGVYVAASVETADGVSVGMANDITAGLRPRQSALVNLEDYQGTGGRFRITDVNCM